MTSRVERINSIYMNNVSIAGHLLFISIEKCYRNKQWNYKLLEMKSIYVAVFINFSSVSMKKGTKIKTHAKSFLNPHIEKFEQLEDMN